MNLEQFCLAMHLVQQKLSGVDPPQTLPANMVPPSMRGLVSDTAVLYLVHIMIQRDIIMPTLNNYHRTASDTNMFIINIMGVFGRGHLFTSPYSVMNRHPWDHAKVSVHDRWPLVGGTDGLMRVHTKHITLHDYIMHRHQRYSH